VRGTMAFLFRETLDRFQAEGVGRIDMCLDPARHCGQKMEGDSPLVRLGMCWGQSLLNIVFDVPGVRHFKSRFRPQYENRYVCAYPKSSIRSIMAFGFVSGLFDLKLGRLVQIIIERIRKRGARRTLPEID